MNEAIFDHATIGGGNDNKATDLSAVIAGGQSNKVNSAFGAIVGGYNNWVNATHSFIGGGNGNQTQSRFSVIGGGISNITTDNGVPNAGLYTTIPGGAGLEARSIAQTVLGHNNKQQGSRTSFAKNDDRLLIIGNGLTSSTTDRSNAFEVSSNGHSIVFDELAISDAGVATATPTASTIYGGTYIDNIVYGWGDIPQGTPPNVTATSSFGINPVVQFTAPNKYTVTLIVVDPYGSPVLLNQGSVTATITHGFAESDPGCKTISVSNIVNNQFTVFTHTMAGGTCANTALPFSFKVTGRKN